MLCRIFSDDMVEKCARHEVEKEVVQHVYMYVKCCRTKKPTRPSLVLLVENI